MHLIIQKHAILLTAILCLHFHTLSAQGVGIGTTTPDASARVEIQSTDQGILIPRMTAEQRNMINMPATGLLVYQTDGDAGFWFYNGTSWASLSGNSSGPVKEIADDDDNTKIQVEEGDDDDNTIRFDIAGQEVMTIDSVVRINDHIDQLLVGNVVPDERSRIQIRSDQSNGIGLTGTVTGSIGIGVYGTADNTSAVTNYGGQFNANGTFGTGVSGLSLGVMGRGVYGLASNASAVTNYGGYFWANGSEGRGVYGEATGAGAVAVYGNANNSSGSFNYGGFFKSNGENGRGVYGEATGNSGRGVFGNATHTFGQGLRGEATGTSGIGVVGVAENESGTTNAGGYFVSFGSQGRGVRAEAKGASGRAVYGLAEYDQTGSNYGGYFEAEGSTGRGVFGHASNTSGANYGGRFEANGIFGSGVYGIANNTSAMFNTGGFFVSNGIEGTGVLGWAQGAGGIGVRGTADSTFAVAIFGESENGWAGLFDGYVEVQGNLRIGSFNTFDGTETNLLRVSSNFVPEDDNTYDLGNDTLRWYNIWATNGVIQTSDKRNKTGIQEIQYGIDAVLAMKPVQYYWKDDQTHSRKLGLVAQDLKQIVPEVVKSTAVSIDENGDRSETATERLGVYYSDLIPVLIKAIQELEDRVRQLEK